MSFYVILVSNHSYGYGITDSFPTARFGYYDQTADFDKISEVFPLLSNCQQPARNSTNPQVAAAGFDMLTVVLL
jgi:hypothetical protein